MTVMAEGKPQVSVEEFEQIAKSVAADFDSVRLEFIDGRIGIKGMPDGDHHEIIMWLQHRCMQQRPDLGLYSGEQGLKIETYRRGRARPDGSLARRGTFAGQGEWADPADVLMAVEVTSYDADTHRRDRQQKPAAYAEAGIPVYLLIDREGGALTVHSDPDREKGEYRGVHTLRPGGTLILPEPVGIELETAELTAYLR